MATVHRAIEHQPDGSERVVAIKRLLPHLAEDAEFVRSFGREARLAARLDHPNIVRIHKLGRSRDGHFISMEYVAGRDLSEILKRAHRVSSTPPIGAVLSLLIELCDALDYAHHCKDGSGAPLGLIHRDISPGNLLVDQEGHLRVIDFGIAKATLSDENTRTGLVKGKFSYMSPEAIEGKPLDARSDIFSVGVVAHELLTARPLFPRGNDYHTLQQIQRAETYPASKHNHACPVGLDAVVLRALAKEAEERWQSAAELRSALESVGRDFQPHATADAVVEWLQAVFADRAGDLEELEVDIEVTPSEADDQADDEAATAILPNTPIQPAAVWPVAPLDLAVGPRPAAVRSRFDGPAHGRMPVRSAIGFGGDRPFGANIRRPGLDVHRRTVIVTVAVAALAAVVLLAPRIEFSAGGRSALAGEGEPGSLQVAVPVPVVESIAVEPMATRPTVAPPIAEREPRSRRRVAVRETRLRTDYDPRAREVPTPPHPARPATSVTASLQPIDLDLDLVAPPATSPGAQARPVVLVPDQVERVSGDLPTLVARTRQPLPLPKRVSAKLCIGETGEVTSVSVLTATPKAIEVEIETALLAWRYRPYRQDGRPVPACFAVSFRTSGGR